MRLLLAFIMTFGALCMAQVSAMAQSGVIQQARSKIYQGYRLNQPDKWREGISLLRQAANQSASESLLYELALAEYGLIGYCVASESCDDVYDRIDDTQDILDKLVDKVGTRGKAYAVYGGLLAMKIGLSPAKALYLGPRSSGYLDKAMEIAANSPYTWVEHGNMRFHAPAVFGGDKAGAVEAFQKAIELFDQQPAEKTNNWVYLHAIAWLGQAYEATGQLNMARQTYEKALRVAPDFHWVKYELLPAVKQKGG